MLEARLRLSGEAKDHELVVQFEATGGHPAITTGHPDTHTPAEGPDIEIDSVSMVRGKTARKLSYTVIDHYMESIYDAIHDVLEDRR